MLLAGYKNANVDPALGSPIESEGRITAIEQMLSAIAATLGLGATRPDTDIRLTALSAPTGTAITQGGTAASTNYTYVVADVSNIGRAPASGVQTTTGAATLTAVNYNIVSWTGIVGHRYHIYRSASSGTPSTVGYIGAMTAATVTPSFNDTGIAATGNVPTGNTSGSIEVAGNMFTSGRLLRGANIPSVTGAGAVTWTAAQVLQAPLALRSGVTGAISDVLPTAAALVAALPGVKVNQGFELSVRNANTGTLTFTAPDATVTLAAGNTNTLATLHVKRMLFQFTTVTVGSEAVTVYMLDDSAY